jgi:hypothetical protein
MFSFSTILSSLNLSKRAPDVAPASALPEPARRLMESAGARAGQHPSEAQELRDAARAYLSVVR